MPVYWLGEVMNLISQSRFHDTNLLFLGAGAWLQAADGRPGRLVQDAGHSWFTLAALYIGISGRVLRANLVEAYQEDFIRTARAKGLSPARVMLRHALRTSLIPFVTMVRPRFRRAGRVAPPC